MQLGTGLFARVALLVLASVPLAVTAGLGSPISGDQFVVTNLRLVEAPSREAALELCQGAQAELTSSGIDWGQGPNGGPAHLCQRRERVATYTGPLVLQALQVVADGSVCPPQATVVRKHKAITVCAQYAPTASALKGGIFISDVTVTEARNYNNEGPGWTTIPVHVGDNEAMYHKGVYLSYRQPVLPISALKVLTDAKVNDPMTACVQDGGAGWRSAGNGFLDGPTSGTSAKTVLCTKVAHDPQGTAFEGLVDLALSNGGDSCPEGFTQRHTLNTEFALCSKWQKSESLPTFVADVILHRATSLNGPDPTAAEYLPGKFDLVANKNLNVVQPASGVFLFTRKYKTQRFQPPRALGRKPLVARTSRDGGTGLVYKILQLADLHFTGDATTKCNSAPNDVPDCTEAQLSEFVNEVLDAENPDFVVFTGDNVEVDDAALRQQAMEMATGSVEARGIPYAMVFGNHDDQSGFLREDIATIAISKKNCYMQRGPRDVDGVGNYELNVLAPTSGGWGTANTQVLRMYFLDSHAYTNRGRYPQSNSTYDWVKPSQIAYYRQLSEAHAAANNRVPALMFFHIPLPEYSASSQSKTKGEARESVSSPRVNSNLFSTLVDIGEVKATFVGHDHVNEYCYKREGINLCYGGGAGMGRAYGHSDFARRVRTIEWSVDNNGKRQIRSWKRHHGSVQVRRGEEVLYKEN